MKRLAATFAALTMVGAEVASSSDEHVTVTRVGSQPSAIGPENFFTGSVRIDSRFSGTGDARAGGGVVTFEPGARTAWHTHPLGQTLIVTAGVGYVQQAGNERQEIRPGDVVWIPPRVRHWHGATSTTGMSHIAISEAENGQTVTWGEKVTDAEYGNSHEQ